MLKIRLARGGAKKRPFYSIVVADSHSPRDGRFIEKVGTYDPLAAKDHPERLRIKTERVAEWMSKGAQPTDRVARLLSSVGAAQWTAGNNPKKGQPGKKAQERLAEKTQRETDAKAAAEAAAAAPPPVVEEPVVEEAVVEEAPAAVEEPAAAEEAAPVEEAAAEAAPAEEA